MTAPPMRAFFLAFTLLAFLLGPTPARSGLIRDAEVERTIRMTADPIFRAAAIDPGSVHVFIVGNTAINAFVAGGMNIFIHTGLILATDKPEMLAGVIAHETGHITGGHLAKGTEQLQQATIGAVISYILGGVAVAAGAGDVGAAVISGGGNIAERSMLSFTRTNENAADAAALRFLATANISAEGLLEVFKVLQRDEKRRFGQPDPYAITHPLTRERVNTLRDYLSGPDASGNGFDEQHQQRYQRMLGKLEGFLDDPQTVRSRYRGNVSGLRARYALAIADFRSGDVDEAVALLETMIKESPKDGYYYDTLGQVLYESGRIRQAVATYEKAAALEPDEGLIQASYGQALLASDDAALLQPAITTLERATQLDNTYADAWRALAGAYGRAGRLGDQHLALAEEAMLGDDVKTAIAQSKRAMTMLETGSPARMRAVDINTLATREQTKKEGEKTPFLR